MLNAFIHGLLHLILVPHATHVDDRKLVKECIRSVVNHSTHFQVGVNQALWAYLRAVLAAQQTI